MSNLDLSGERREALTTPALTDQERARRRETKARRRGLLLVFTGNGKGKSTAAFGLALRAAGNRLPVKVVQFIKGSWKTGEREAIRRGLPEIEVEVGGRGFTIQRLRDPKIPIPEHHLAARAALRWLGRPSPRADTEWWSWTRSWVRSRPGS